MATCCSSVGLVHEYSCSVMPNKLFEPTCEDARGSTMALGLMNESALKSRFGSDASLHRIWLSHLKCYGTSVAATITPKESQAETLTFAWALTQQLASWLLAEAQSLPKNERYEVIVGWSASVRPRQGQIFKTGGTRSDIHRVVASPTSESLTSHDHNPLRNNWQYDVFAE
jgi:hypothetical protein